MIGIVTDSSSDLPPELAERHNIEVAQLAVRFGDRSYVDGVDLSSTAFWNKLRKAREIPTVLPPPAEAFQAALERSAARGTDEILVLCGAGGIIASQSSANLVAQEGYLPVRVVDSEAVSIGLGTMVLAAARAAELGARAEDVLAAATRARPEFLGAADSSDHFRKAGNARISKALFAKRAKPLFTIQSGAIEVVGSARSRSRALAALIEWLGDRKAVQEVAIVHGDAPDIDEVASIVRDNLPSLQPLVVPAGPALGVNVGPDFIGLAAGSG